MSTQTQVIKEYKTKRTNKKIRILEYEPWMSNSALALENSSQRNKTFWGLVQYMKLNPVEYSYKSKKFKDNIILVAEEPVEGVAHGRICGVVNLGIKTVKIGKRPVKMGYLFDLRVDTDYQGDGIGFTLSDELEKMARTKGCEAIYLSVNSNNGQAIKLYHKMGYTDVSLRKLAFKILSGDDASAEEKGILANDNTVLLKKTLTNPKYAGETMIFRKATREEAKDFSEQYYEDKDLTVHDWDELFNLEGYDGCYVAHTADKKNIAGAHLYKDPMKNVITFERILFHRDSLNKTWFHLIMLGTLSLIPLGVFALLWKLGVNNNVNLVLSGGLSLGLVLAYSKLLKIAAAFGGRKSRGRVVNPFYSGDPELEGELLGYVSQNIQKVAAVRGMGFFMHNYDMRNRLQNYFTKGALGSNGPGTRYMMKWLLPNAQRADADNITMEKENRNLELTEINYFDPRDF